ncbi:MAG TPA: ATP-binding cassette domain-containing protein, partial [Vicinamibacterales bacterium]|nr:ATP-binding cassette domain-containing protein [Vicinamibacterales bacterium]
LRKQYGGLRPLRINALSVNAGDRITLHGLDAESGEMLTLLITGASLPDEGTVAIAGRDTRDIQTDTEWLTSLDVFGMVSTRAALMDSVALEGNMALPFTLSIDPLAPEIRRAVESLAEEVELPAGLLAEPVNILGEAERARVHLARALALKPQVLLLEHPTAKLRPEDAAAFGRLLATIAERRDLSWLAISEDAAFASRAGGRQCRLLPATGEICPVRRPWRLW